MSGDRGRNIQSQDHGAEIIWKLCGPCELRFVSLGVLKRHCAVMNIEIADTADSSLQDW